MNISLDKISFNYGRKSALKEISAIISQGITVLLGPNASGKSTLIKCMAGGLKPRGKITIDNTELDSLSRNKRNEIIGYLPQQDFERCSFTVFETVLLGLASGLAWHPSDTELEAVKKVLVDTELLDVATQRVDQLSGGQQRMTAVAQTLVRNPKILLLDEPVNSLDYKHQLSLFMLLRKITRIRSMTTVVALHDLNLAASFADQIIVLKEGEIHCSGSAEDTITRDTIEDVYRVKADIIRHNGSSVVVPLIPNE